MREFYIEEVSLSNFRKFEDKKFKLDRTMNVFIGKNGSGKTTVLESINVLLGAYLAAFKEYVPSRYVFNISESDVHLKTNVVDNEYATAPTIPQYPCSVGGKLYWKFQSREGNIKDYKRILEKVGSRTKFMGPNPMQADVVEWESRIKTAAGEDKELIFPLVLYLSSARLWNENKQSVKLEKIPHRMEAYQRCLDKKRSAQFAFEYLRLLANLAIEENKGKPYPAYSVIMEAIQHCFVEELEPDQEIFFSSRFGEIVQRNEDGTVIQFSELSDGYRNVIKIVSDIAARMCVLNPYSGRDTLKVTPGIVVIDELDLSLHPTWQRRIVRILKELFPKVQFVCATHSPFIIQSLEDGELKIVDSELKTEEYSGVSIEDIATDIMGVEFARYSENKEKMYKIAKSYFEKIQKASSDKELNELKEQLDLVSSKYSDNPAYCALLEQKYLVRKTEIEG